jgi:diacylglycerol kinase family enzyme
MVPIGVIHNPFAKGNLKRSWVAPKLRAALGDAGILRETRNVNELGAVAQEFLDQGVETVGINGGDGTLHLVLTAFIKVYGDRPLPKVMSLRGGSMNTMSNSLKIKGDTIGIVKRAMRNLREGKPFHERPQHLVKVNDKYGFMSGAGAIGVFLDFYYSGTSTGPVHAAKVFSQTVWGVLAKNEYGQRLRRPHPARVTVDGKRLEPEAFTVMLACSIKELGLGFAPTPHAYDRPGCFHFIGADIDPVRVIPQLLTIWLGRDLRHPHIQYSHAAEDVIIEPLAPLRYTVDGEMYDAAGPLHFTRGPTITVVEPQ